MLMCRLEERYAKNNKRRRLLYALRRRKSSNSFRNRWDCICNEARSAKPHFLMLPIYSPAGVPRS